jgi:hypothetical protein
MCIQWRWNFNVQGVNPRTKDEWTFDIWYLRSMPLTENTSSCLKLAIIEWLTTGVLRTRSIGYNKKQTSNYFLECTCGRSGLHYICNATQYWFSALNFNSYRNFHFSDFTPILNGPRRNIKSRLQWTYFGSIKHLFSYSILWAQNTLLLTWERNMPNTPIQISSKIIFLSIKIFSCEGPYWWWSHLPAG